MRVLQDSLTSFFLYCQAPAALPPRCALPTFGHMEPSSCPQYPSSFSHMPKPSFMPYPWPEGPFQSFSHLGTSYPSLWPSSNVPSLREPFPHVLIHWLTNICGRSWVTGVNDTETNSDGDTQRHTERSFGNQKSLPRKQSWSPWHSCPWMQYPAIPKCW